MAKRYSPKLKFQVVLELLKGDRTPSQVARAYNVHPNSAGLWRRALLEKGPEIFSKDSVVGEYERRLADLEQLLGKKEQTESILPSINHYAAFRSSVRCCHSSRYMSLPIHIPHPCQNH